MIGRITSVFGVKGWLKVFSYTDPKDGILNYPDWTLDLDGKRIPAKLEEGRRQGQGIVVRLKGINDRDLARTYCGAEGSRQLSCRNFLKGSSTGFSWKVLMCIRSMMSALVKCTILWKPDPTMFWWYRLRQVPSINVSV